MPNRIKNYTDCIMCGYCCGYRRDTPFGGCEYAEDENIPKGVQTVDRKIPVDEEDTCIYLEKLNNGFARCNKPYPKVDTHQLLRPPNLWQAPWNLASLSDSMVSHLRAANLKAIRPPSSVPQPDASRKGIRAFQWPDDPRHVQFDRPIVCLSIQKPCAASAETVDDGLSSDLLNWS